MKDYFNLGVIIIAVLNNINIITSKTLRTNLILGNECTFCSLYGLDG